MEVLRTDLNGASRCVQSQSTWSLHTTHSPRKTYHPNTGKRDLLGGSKMSKVALEKSFWKGKNVLVTGASGFAGRNLCNLLSPMGSRVRCFVRSTNDFSV